MFVGLREQMPSSHAVGLGSIELLLMVGVQKLSLHPCRGMDGSDIAKKTSLACIHLTPTFLTKAKASF